MSEHEDLMRQLANQARESQDLTASTPESHEDLMKKLAAGAASPKVKRADAGVPSSSDDQIEPESQYHDIGPVSDSLDYSGNVGKSALYGLLQDPTSFVGDTHKAKVYAEEALAKKRRTSSSQIMDKLAENSHVEGHGLPLWDRLSDGRETHLFQNLGHDNGGGATQDLLELGKKGVDKAREIGIDLAADPLTYVMGLHPSGTKAKAAVRGAMGGMIGYGASGSHDSPLQKILQTGAGVAAGAAGPAVAAEAGKMAKPLAEGAYDWLPRYMKGDRFKNFSENYGLAKEGVKERDLIAHQIVQNYGRHTSHFAPEALGEAKDLAGKIKTQSNEFVKGRKAAYVEATGSKKFPVGFQNQSRDLFLEKNPDAAAKALAGAKPEVRDAYHAIEKHNTEMQDWVNRRLGSPDGKWFVTEENGRKVAKGIGNMPYHVEDLHAYKDIDEALKTYSKPGLTGPLRASLSSTRAGTWNTLGAQKSYDIYANRIAKNFLTEAQKDALRFVQEYHAAPYAGKAQKVLGYTGDLVNGMNNIFKKSTLFTGANFIRNHMLEDMKKSYMTNGLPGLIDATVALPKNYLKFKGDIAQIMKGNYYHAFENPDVADAFLYGAADPHNTFWANQSGMTEDYARLRFGDKGVETLNDAKTTKAKVKGAVTKVLQTLASPATVLAEIPGSKGKLGIKAMGQALETTMRVSHFARSKQMLMDSVQAMEAFGGQGIKKSMLGNEKALAKAGVNIDSLNRFAAKLTNDTFFNYRDANALNDKVLSKVIPFFNFHLNNAKLYIESSVNPTRMARVHQAMYVTRPPRQQPFTAKEAAGLPPYTRESNPQLDKRYPNGAVDVHYEPKDTYNEAGKFIMDPAKTVLDNLNPALKLAVEHEILGKDSFSGLPLSPSETSSGKLPVFGSGYLGMAEKHQLDKLPPDLREKAEMAMGLYGNQFSKNGYPEATDDTSHTIDRVESNMIPKTGLDQLFKFLGDTHIPGVDQAVFGERPGKGRYDVGQALENLTGPYQVQHLEPWQLQRNAEGSKWDKAKRKHLQKNLEKQQARRRADFGG